jgi:hypothetical protein
MRKFEYMYANIAVEGDPVFFPGLVSKLNDLGKQGWEMVDAVSTREIKIPQYPTVDAFSTRELVITKTYYSVILKRGII